MLLSGLITEQLFCLVSFLWLWTYRNSCLMLSSWPCCWPPAGLCSVTSYQVHISYWLCVWASRYIFITDQRIACYWTVVLFGHLRKSPLGPEKGDCPWPAMQTIFRESFSYVFCQFSPSCRRKRFDGLVWFGFTYWWQLIQVTSGSEVSFSTLLCLGESSPGWFSDSLLGSPATGSSLGPCSLMRRWLKDF